MLKTATHDLNHVSPRILQVQRSIMSTKLDSISYLLPTGCYHLPYHCLWIWRRNRNMEKPAMVIIERCWTFELRVYKFKYLEPDAVTRAQPCRLDLLQAVRVDLDHRRGGRFAPLGQSNRAQLRNPRIVVYHSTAASQLGTETAT